MTDAEVRSAAKDFIAYWTGRGYEKGESQPFWLSLLSKVFGVENPERFITFEDRVMIEHTSFIDAKIEATHVLIEQKGIDRDLRKPFRQSNGLLTTPFRQAKRYAAELRYSQRPRWIVLCNFKSFLVYDTDAQTNEPEEILLENLDKEYYRLNFLVDTGDDNIKKEMEISIQAGRLVGILYDEILKQYIHPESEDTLKSLNKLCVRLVFCLYAEDAGVFGKHLMFHHYIRQFQPRDVRRALIDLFRVLNTKPEDRDPYLNQAIAAFPYVNGDLFADDDIEIPQFNQSIVDLLLHKASEDFDWSEISPTIFGAVFESTLNPETRRSGGMHYTSIENIHKVIDPLFLDDLKEELETIKAVTVLRTRVQRLRDYQSKLANLTFLDPACGSGNFLTETYLSLRKLENEVIRCLIDSKKGETAGQIMFGDSNINPIQVSIKQFYGIEINDFAVSVAQTALWIAQSQMLKQTEDILHMRIDFLPLKSYANIHEANALRIDWESVVPKTQLNYIMGNPPFVGKKEQTKQQKAELCNAFGDKVKGTGNLDYVAGWYKKASEVMQDTTIHAAFVSTNSITQGEQAPVIGREIFCRGLKIEFAYRTFRWDSQASLKAHVHCVIIGFSYISNMRKRIFINEMQIKDANNINPYLIDAPTVIIEARSKTICSVLPINYGSMPIDNGHLILEREDVQTVLAENPENKKFVRKYMGGLEVLQGKERWCLWLRGFSPREIQTSKFIMNRIHQTAEFRKSSGRPQTQRLADTPTLFGEIRQPDTDMLVIPKVSSENRRYIPIAYIQPEIIVNGSALIVPNASKYEFGVLSSNVHNSWMRVVAGRMKSDYQYSANIVYNNYPWPKPTDEQKVKIEQTAQAILDARALYPDSSLADLYDEVTMPPELRKAHQNNDRAVMKAYGFSMKMTESECVAELMKLYQKLMEQQ